MAASPSWKGRHQALAEFTLGCSDLMELEIVPLIPLARGPFVLPRPRVSGVETAKGPNSGALVLPSAELTGSAVRLVGGLEINL
jgi:hypothetical protein